MTERELVRCGCGTVRNDEDPPVPLAFASWQEVHQMGIRHFRPSPEEPPELEAPRACRRCGAVYMLPRQQAPTEESPG